MDIIDPRLDKYSLRNSTKVDPIFDDLRKETLEQTSTPEWQVGPVEGMLLKMLVRMTGAKTVLEFGTFTGYSALMMASGLPQAGKLCTLDRDKKTNAIARRYFDRAPYGSKITTILGDARETMKRVPGPIDLVFIDADKSSYDLYYEDALSKLSPEGTIVLDNTLWSGGVLDPSDGDARAIDQLNRKIALDERVEAVLLTVRDGVTVLRRR